MKILILRNKFNWSLDSKLDTVKKWFKMDLEFTVENTKYVDIPHTLEIFSTGYQAPIVDKLWYDENISKPAKERGFDCVVFLMRKQDWKGELAQGYRTHNNLQIQEIVALANKTGSYNYSGVPLEGDQLTWILIHELLHALYLKENREDNVHKWFLLKKPEECLKDFMEWKYFKLTEKTGSLGHTVADLDKLLVDKLDILRGICGFPFVITSGYRTEEENRQVGGVEGSAHTKRLAVDIACTDAQKRIKIIGEAYSMGFIGIGIDKEFVHLDIDTTHSKRIWLY